VGDRCTDKYIYHTLQRLLVRRRIICAVTGSTLVAFTLCGSTWRTTNPKPASSAEIALYKTGRFLYDNGEYTRAIDAFRSAALQAERDGSPRQAAMNWNNVGAAALARMDFRDALPALEKAKITAANSKQLAPLLITLNNLADLYLEMGDPASSMRAVREGLAAIRPETDPVTYSRFHFHLATALAHLHRFDEAEPMYRLAIAEVADVAMSPVDLETAARMLGNYGNECLEIGRLEEAEDALSKALWLVRVHRLNASANILRALAKLKARRGDARSGASLFNAALEAPPSMTPRWVIYADRGEFRLNTNDLTGALEDFREARAIAAQMRADVVPADLDRVALANGLNSVPAGLVDAGNRLAVKANDAALLRETFDAAEQDRLWSLRALVPSANDWRTRLPGEYWDRLAKFQIVERQLMAQPSAGLKSQAAMLERELRELEASADDGAHPAGVNSDSALDHARRLLDSDTVLLSFHITDSVGWLWAVDRDSVQVYRVPAARELKASIHRFAEDLRQGHPEASQMGADLYQQLFGSVANRYVSRKLWLLELDGPLFDLPMSALVAGYRDSRRNEPIYLSEKAVLQSIPGASLLQKRTDFANGPFLGVGDPVYNAADARYEGTRERQDVVLPRLPSTAGELDACSRAWNAPRTSILKGPDANLQSVRAGLLGNPAVIHFATHIIQGPEFYSSGLIALSLDSSGAIGLMGPAEIVARPVSASLVVLNGCHSGTAESVPGAGLMGLTRAWIGAGARSVLATQWDIPDEGGASMMVEFYKALRAGPARGPAYALQQAQLRLMKSRAAGGTPAVWAAYFVVGREQ
jgi:CHAT domain-containing protein/Tfp pilus assembly protein PilF